jgi:hypothetical protein
MVDIKTSEVAVKLAPVKGHKMLNSGRSSEDKQLLIRQFVRKTKKYEHGGRLIFKINILLYGGNS